MKMRDGVEGQLLAPVALLPKTVGTRVRLYLVVDKRVLYPCQELDRDGPYAVRHGGECTEH
jgi:hypothetical protein